MVTRVMEGVLAMGRALQRAGPYLLIEIVLPGGTLIALLLLMYRRGPAQVRADLKRISAAVRVTLRTTADRWRQAARAQGVVRPRRPSARARDGLEPLGFALD